MASAGVVVTVGTTRLVVLEDGSRLVPLWPARVHVADADRVQVLVVNGTAHVIGPVAPSPTIWPVSGTITGAASSGTIPVSTDTGTVRARYTGTAPAIGTLVGLLWHPAGTPFLVPGTLAPVPSDPQPTTPPDVPAPPPSGPQSGTGWPVAAGSGTWRTGGWGWASSSDVLQGGAPYVSQDSRGGWWYGAAAGVLAGRRITDPAIRLGARLRTGDYNDPATVHLYLTSNTTRPGADFTRVAGPVDVVLAPGAPAAWYPLPAAWGQALVDDGGGIAIAGSPYVGVAGIGSDPASGQLRLPWTR
jgi:hypothetical protein